MIGYLVRAPKRARIASGKYGLGQEKHPARTSRLGVVEFDYPDDGEVTLRLPKGTRLWVMRDDLEIIDERSHTLRVTREKLGGHAIRGWNWPLWGYNYNCDCGASFADREDYARHLEQIATREEVN